MRFVRADLLHNWVWKEMEPQQGGRKGESEGVCRPCGRDGGRGEKILLTA